MKKLGNWFTFSWYPALLLLVGVLFVGFLLWFQIGGLVPGLNEAETAQSVSANSLQSIRENPLNAPHKLLRLAFSSSGIAAFPGRVASVIIGLSLVGCFFFVLKSWYSRRVAVLGALLFACSAWFLHIARFGTDNVMYAALIVPVACLAWMQRRDSGLSALLTSGLLIAILLYTPGMIWFVMPALIWQFERVSRFLHKQNAVVLAFAALLGIGLLTPLVFSFYTNPELIKTYLGMPASFPAPLEILKNIAGVPIQLFLRGPDVPALWLGRLPLIDWFGSIMFIIGAYAYYLKWGLDRSRAIGFAFVIGTVLVSLDGPVTMGILLPLVYLLIAGGIAFMLQQWFTVFPRNPFARTIGPVLMTLTVLMSVFYNVNHYFVAWPNAPETRAAFDQTVEKRE